MAVVTALLAMLLMLAVGAGVTLTTMTETGIAANHRDGLQALYAAEAGLVLGTNRLRATADWQAWTTARGPTALFAGRLADLAQSGSIDPGIDVTVSVMPDADHNPDILVVQSSAGLAGGIGRSVQVRVRRLAPDASGARLLEISSWR